MLLSSVVVVDVVDPVVAVVVAGATVVVMLVVVDQLSPQLLLAPLSLPDVVDSVAVVPCCRSRRRC